MTEEEEISFFLSKYTGVLSLFLMYKVLPYKDE